MRSNIKGLIGICIAQALLASEVEQDFYNTHNEMSYDDLQKEYDLIMQKKSKLSRKQRAVIVSTWKQVNV